ncbi:MAG: arylsulfatase [Planctomycetes bacterium]|nr:arylsulfatase [Planctomycetota bacterium]
MTALRRIKICLFAGVAALAAATAGDAAEYSTPAERPNIVLIMSDDMGFSDLGCYGSEIHTPNLDRLAANGVRFTQFYNTARCCPTRASLMTGLYPHQAGVGHMLRDTKLPGYTTGLTRDCVTIAEVLHLAGYRTYMVGKWHVTHFVAPEGPKDNWPLQRGFEKFYGTITGAGSYYDPTTLCRGNTYITPVNDPKYRPKRFYYTDAITDNALLFLREHAKESSDRPFFLYIAYTAAHWPMHALPEDIAKYRGRYDAGYEPIRKARFARLKQLGLIDAHWELSPQAGDWSQVKNKAWEARCMEVYAAMIDRMDQGIGRVVEELRKRDWLDNTLILFLQDNGGCAEPMGRSRPKKPYAKYKPMGPNDLQPKIWPPMQTRDGRPVRVGPGVMPGPEDTYIAYGKAWANVSNTPFREYKHWVHEGGISTPLIAHWPARIKRRGELEDQPGHLIDIMATCVDVARAMYPKRYKGREIQPMEGVSLVPAFDGRPLRRPDAIYWEHEGNRAVRVGKWKLVAKGASGPWELYDMEKDRTEMHDLAAAHPEKVRELAARWEAWARRARVKPWPWTPKAKRRPTRQGRQGKATHKRKR